MLKAGDWVRWTPANDPSSIAQVVEVYPGYVTIKYPDEERWHRSVPRRELKKVSQKIGAMAVARAALGV